MKKHLTTVAIFLLAGAVVNVAVAWGCAAWARPKAVNLVTLSSREVRWLYRRGFVIPDRLREMTPEDRARVFQAKRWSFSDHSQTEVSGDGVTWHFVTADSLHERGDVVLPIPAMLVSAGVPAKSMAGGFSWPRSDGLFFPGKPANLWDFTFYSTLWDVPITGALGLSSRPIPLISQWPGFLINMLFYGTLLWLLVSGPFVIRRSVLGRQRLAQGLCPKCAYPMGESAVCTECGRDLPKRVREAT